MRKSYTALCGWVIERDVTDEPKPSAFRVYTSKSDKLGNTYWEIGHTYDLCGSNDQSRDNFEMALDLLNYKWYRTFKQALKNMADFVEEADDETA